MKKTIQFFLILSLLSSCSNDDVTNTVTTTNCQIKSMQTKCIVVDDVELSTGANMNFSDSIYFDYDTENRIVKITGGLKNLPGNDLFHTVWGFTKGVEDLVSYNQDTISVNYASNMEVKPFTKKFIVTNDKLVFKEVTYFNKFNFNLGTYTHTYEYSNNQIIEKRDGILYATFTLDNGNLIKVERLINNSVGQLLYREIYNFTNYDNHINPLKGKFFITGYFLKAFSNNNCKNVAFSKFKVIDGVEVQLSSYSSTIDFGYNPDGIANLFEQICK